MEEILILIGIAIGIIAVIAVIYALAFIPFNEIFKEKK